jgi:MFS transporter, PAT family, beta-lactamase induction signal transducer AmpG
VAAVETFVSVFRSRKIFLLLLLGFSSGLPLALTGGTLQAWLAAEGVDIQTIGWFALVGQPYVYKFLWAPFMDRYQLPFLGRRRGWLLATQALLLASIAWMGSISPQQSPWLLAGAALLVAFLSASQDIVFDAYRADVLDKEEQGPGAGISVAGYRIAMIVSGGLALIIVDEYQASWWTIYTIMAVLMVVGVAATWAAAEPAVPGKLPLTLAAAVREPLADYFSRNGAWLFLLVIILYKLGDAFAGSLTTAFLLRGPQFSLADVGWANKWLGAIATILGAIAGGALLARLRLYRALLLFGALQAITNLGYMLVAMAGKNYALMISAVAAENLCGGMGTAAFVALLIALCNRRFSATQYALLSALASLGRVYVGPVAGALVASYGWTWFFFLTFLIALPGVAMLWWIRARIEALDRAAPAT